jgi:hypothetical protein
MGATQSTQKLADQPKRGRSRSRSASPKRRKAVVQKAVVQKEASPSPKRRSRSPKRK